jgi:gliding motility-associated-like protein
MLLACNIAQSQSMKWLVKAVSGQVSLVDFSTPTPTLTPTITGYGVGAEEEVNIMTDAANNILFTSACNGNDIIQIRDANFNLMANGTLRGNSSALESAICKVPCTTDQYYFFNYKNSNGADSLFYAIIDLSANGGLGAVTQKHLYLGSGFTEGMTISHQMRNGCRWLIVPGFSGNNLTLNAFKISNTGIAPSVVLDTYPMVNPVYISREVELSMNNLKIAMSTFSAGNTDADILLYDFDLENGSVSNRQSLSVSTSWVLGIEFSPDATKLYYQTNTNTAGTSALGRIDLNNNAIQIIDNSRDQYLTDPELAGNGKIYIGWNYTNNYISEIGDPNNNIVGNIQYTKNAIFVSPSGCRPGFPNVIDGEPPGTSIVPSTVDFAFHSTLNCGEYIFNDSSCLGSWWEWDFGDSILSNIQNPTHQYAANGNYNVNFRVKVCSDTLSITKSIQVTNTSLTLSTSPNAISCNNAPVTLYANGATTYTWSPQTGLNTGTGSLVIANPSSTTEYTVTASNNGACPATATILVTTVNPSVSLSASATQVCSGNSVTLVASGNGNLLWSNGLTNDTIVVSQSGMYQVQLTDSGCIVNDSIAITVLAAASPQLNTFSSPWLCTGDTAVYFITGVNIISQQWYFNNNILTGDTSTSLSIINNGNYSVVTTDINGCTMSESIIINFHPNPHALFSSSTIPCHDSILIKNNSINSISYKWIVDSLLSDTIMNPDIQFTSLGNHSITLIAANGTCVDSMTQNVFTAPNPAAQFNSDSICSLTKYFHNNSVNASQYTWIFDNGVTSNQYSPHYTFPDYGTYKIKLLAQNQGGCIDSTEKSIEIVEHMPSEFTISLATCANQTIFIPINSSAKYYNWNLGDNTYDNSATVMHSYSQSGSYSITLITNFGFPCQDNTTKEVLIPEIPVSHLYIPNTFTPNYDGINDDFAIQGLADCDHYELFIYNRWGQLVFETNEIGPRWNGIYKDRLVEEDVYCYLIKMNGHYLQGMVLVLY